jgi:hypothetical protein
VGGDPRLVFLDEAGNEIKEVNISEHDVEGIKNLLEAHGIFSN